MKSKVDTQLLREALRLTEPTLAKSEVVLPFKCFKFEGGKVETYNETTGIRAPLDVPFAGCVRGEVLVNYITSIKRKQLEVTEQKGKLLLKAGGSKLTVDLSPVEDFKIDAPAYRSMSSVKITDSFAEDVKKCLVTMSVDTSEPQFVGVTLDVGADGANLFSTNVRAMTYVRSDVRSKKSAQLILPPTFCELFVQLCGSLKPVKLYYSKQLIACKFKDGVELFTKALPDANTGKYMRIVNSGLTDKHRKQALPVPKAFSKALERAGVVSSGAESYFPTSLSMLGDRLTVETQGAYGKVKDGVRVKGKHAEVEAWGRPEGLTGGLPYADKFYFTEHMLVFFGLNYAFCVSLSPKKTTK